MVAHSSPIQIWDRAGQRLITEQVYGDFWLRLAYGSGFSRLVVDQVLARRWVSRLAGRLQSTPGSARRVQAFAEQFDIEMGEFEDRKWSSFNDFFIRRFRDGAREFCAGPERMPAFSEARYLAFERITPDQTFPVKGQHLTPEAILGDRELAADFDGGPLLLARLAPVDYHRFHFPDDGTVVSERRVSGRLHSVHPFALRHRGDILATNERQVTVLDTANFGQLAMVEVGAMNVGLIVQTHSSGERFRRGDEKGYFCFGASSILLFGEPGQWRPSEDLIEQTASQRETLVRLGEEVGCGLKVEGSLHPPGEVR
jgi:phosphatidylserine decarboxylase